MFLKDRRKKPVITHRISCGRVSGTGQNTRIEKLDGFEITTFERIGKDGHYVVDRAAMDALEAFGPRYVHKRAKRDGDKPGEETGPIVLARRIPIRVDSDDIEDFVTQRYESRAPLPIIGRDGKPIMVNATTLMKKPQVWCHGDGESAMRLSMDTKTWKSTWNKIRCCSSPDCTPRSGKDLVELLDAGASKHNPEDGFRCPYAQNIDKDAGPTCGPVTKLICRSDVVANIGAFCRFQTHAHSSGDFVVESLMEIKRQMPGGILRNVPLDLVLEMKLLGRPGGHSALQPVSHIELRLTADDTVRLIEANLAVEMRALGAVQESRKLLAAARVEEAEIEEDGEFGPHEAPIEREQKPSGAFDVIVGKD